MTTASSADRQAAKHLTERDLIAELERLYRGKGLRRDVFGRRAALPSEVAAWVANARRHREARQE